PWDDRTSVLTAGVSRKAPNFCSSRSNASTRSRSATSWAHAAATKAARSASGFSRAAKKISRSESDWASGAMFSTILKRKTRLKSALKLSVFYIRLDLGNDRLAGLGTLVPLAVDADRNLAG